MTSLAINLGTIGPPVFHGRDDEVQRAAKCNGQSNNGTDEGYQHSWRLDDFNSYSPLRYHQPCTGLILVQ